ncbi:MAG: hypothetical protein KKH08_01900, partial [Candidatus Omnitrophica bacterium]|nr:hypothetical protein [Candidatus Omnitrophota bacterium]
DSKIKSFRKKDLMTDEGVKEYVEAVRGWMQIPYLARGDYGDIRNYKLADGTMGIEFTGGLVISLDKDLSLGGKVEAKIVKGERILPKEGSIGFDKAVTGDKIIIAYTADGLDLGAKEGVSYSKFSYDKGVRIGEGMTLESTLGYKGNTAYRVAIVKVENDKGVSQALVIMSEDEKLSSMSQEGVRYSIVKAGAEGNILVNRDAIMAARPNEDNIELIDTSNNQKYYYNKETNKVVRVIEGDKTVLEFGDYKEGIGVQFDDSRKLEFSISGTGLLVNSDKFTTLDNPGKYSIYPVFDKDKKEFSFYVVNRGVYKEDGAIKESIVKIIDSKGSSYIYDTEEKTPDIPVNNLAVEFAEQGFSSDKIKDGFDTVTSSEAITADGQTYERIVKIKGSEHDYDKAVGFKVVSEYKGKKYEGVLYYARINDEIVPVAIAGNVKYVKQEGTPGDNKLADVGGSKVTLLEHISGEAEYLLNCSAIDINGKGGGYIVKDAKAGALSFEPFGRNADLTFKQGVSFNQNKYLQETRVIIGDKGSFTYVPLNDADLKAEYVVETPSILFGKVNDSSGKETTVNLTITVNRDNAVAKDAKIDDRYKNYLKYSFDEQGVHSITDNKGNALFIKDKKGNLVPTAEFLKRVDFKAYKGNFITRDIPDQEAENAGVLTGFEFTQNDINNNFILKNDLSLEQVSGVSMSMDIALEGEMSPIGGPAVKSLSGSLSNAQLYLSDISEEGKFSYMLAKGTYKGQTIQPYKFLPEQKEEDKSKVKKDERSSINIPRASVGSKVTVNKISKKDGYILVEGNHKILNGLFHWFMEGQTITVAENGEFDNFIVVPGDSKATLKTFTDASWTVVRQEKEGFLYTELNDGTAYTVDKMEMIKAKGGRITELVINKGDVYLHRTYEYVEKNGEVYIKTPISEIIDKNGNKKNDYSLTEEIVIKNLYIDGKEVAAKVNAKKDILSSSVTVENTTVNYKGGCTLKWASLTQDPKGNWTIKLGYLESQNKAQAFKYTVGSGDLLYKSISSPYALISNGVVKTEYNSSEYRKIKTLEAWHGYTKESVEVYTTEAGEFAFAASVDKWKEYSSRLEELSVNGEKISNLEFISSVISLYENAKNGGNNYSIPLGETWSFEDNDNASMVFPFILPLGGEANIFLTVFYGNDSREFLDQIVEFKKQKAIGIEIGTKEDNSRYFNITLTDEKALADNPEFKDAVKKIMPTMKEANNKREDRYIEENDRFKKRKAGFGSVTSDYLLTTRVWTSSSGSGMISSSSTGVAKKPDTELKPVTSEEQKIVTEWIDLRKEVASDSMKLDSLTSAGFIKMLVDNEAKSVIMVNPSLKKPEGSNTGSAANTEIFAMLQIRGASREETMLHSSIAGTALLNSDFKLNSPGLTNVLDVSSSVFFKQEVDREKASPEEWASIKKEIKEKYPQQVAKGEEKIKALTGGFKEEGEKRITLIAYAPDKSKTETVNVIYSYEDKVVNVDIDRARNTESVYIKSGIVELYETNIAGGMGKVTRAEFRRKPGTRLYEAFDSKTGKPLGDYSAEINEIGSIKIFGLEKYWYHYVADALIMGRAAATTRGYKDVITAKDRFDFNTGIVTNLNWTSTTASSFYRMGKFVSSLIYNFGQKALALNPFAATAMGFGSSWKNMLTSSWVGVDSLYKEEGKAAFVIGGKAVTVGFLLTAAEIAIDVALIAVTAGGWGATAFAVKNVTLVAADLGQYIAKTFTAGAKIAKFMVAAVTRITSMAYNIVVVLTIELHAAGKIVNLLAGDKGMKNLSRWAVNARGGLGVRVLKSIVEMGVGIANGSVISAIMQQASQPITWAFVGVFSAVAPVINALSARLAMGRRMVASSVAGGISESSIVAMTTLLTPVSTGAAIIQRAAFRIWMTFTPRVIISSFKAIGNGIAKSALWIKDFLASNSVKQSIRGFFEEVIWEPVIGAIVGINGTQSGEFFVEFGDILLGKTPRVNYSTAISKMNLTTMGFSGTGGSGNIITESHEDITLQAAADVLGVSVETYKKDLKNNALEMSENGIETKNINKNINNIDNLTGDSTLADVQEILALDSILAAADVMGLTVGNTALILGKAPKVLAKEMGYKYSEFTIFDIDSVKSVCKGLGISVAYFKEKFNISSEGDIGAITLRALATEYGITLTHLAENLGIKITGINVERTRVNLKNIITDLYLQGKISSEEMREIAGILGVDSDIIGSDQRQTGNRAGLTKEAGVKLEKADKETTEKILLTIKGMLAAKKLNFTINYLKTAISGFYSEGKLTSEEMRDIAGILGVDSGIINSDQRNSVNRNSLVEQVNTRLDIAGEEQIDKVSLVVRSLTAAEREEIKKLREKYIGIFKKSKEISESVRILQNMDSREAAGIEIGYILEKFGFKPGEVAKNEAIAFSEAFYVMLTWGENAIATGKTEDQFKMLEDALQKGKVAALETGGGKTFVWIMDQIAQYLKMGNKLRSVLVLESKEAVSKMTNSDKKGLGGAKVDYNALSLAGGLKMVNGSELYDKWKDGDQNAKKELIDALNSSNTIVVIDKYIGHIQNDIYLTGNDALLAALKSQNNLRFDEIDKLLLGEDSFIQASEGEPVKKEHKEKITQLLNFINSHYKDGTIKQLSVDELKKDNNTAAFAIDKHTGKLYYNRKMALLLDSQLDSEGKPVFTTGQLVSCLRAMTDTKSVSYEVKDGKVSPVGDGKIKTRSNFSDSNYNVAVALILENPALNSMQEDKLKPQKIDWQNITLSETSIQASMREIFNLNPEVHIAGASATAMDAAINIKAIIGLDVIDIKSSVLDLLNIEFLEGFNGISYRIKELAENENTKEKDLLVQMDSRNYNFIDTLVNNIYISWKYRKDQGGGAIFGSIDPDINDEVKEKLRRKLKLEGLSDAEIDSIIKEESTLSEEGKINTIASEAAENKLGAIIITNEAGMYGVNYQGNFDVHALTNGMHEGLVVQFRGRSPRGEKFKATRILYVDQKEVEEDFGYIKNKYKSDLRVMWKEERRYDNRAGELLDLLNRYVEGEELSFKDKARLKFGFRQAAKRSRSISLLMSEAYKGYVTEKLKNWRISLGAQNSKLYDLLSKVMVSYLTQDSQDSGAANALISDEILNGSQLMEEMFENSQKSAMVIMEGISSSLEGNYSSEAKELKREIDSIVKDLKVEYRNIEKDGKMTLQKAKTFEDIVKVGKNLSAYLLSSEKGGEDKSAIASVGEKTESNKGQEEISEKEERGPPLTEIEKIKEEISEKITANEEDNDNVAQEFVDSLKNSGRVDEQGNLTKRGRLIYDAFIKLLGLNNNEISKLIRVFPPQDEGIETSSGKILGVLDLLVEKGILDVYNYDENWFYRVTSVAKIFDIFKTSLGNIPSEEIYDLAATKQSFGKALLDFIINKITNSDFKRKKDLNRLLSSISRRINRAGSDEKELEDQGVTLAEIKDIKGILNRKDINPVDIYQLFNYRIEGNILDAMKGMYNPGGYLNKLGISDEINLNQAYKMVFYSPEQARDYVMDKAFTGIAEAISYLEAELKINKNLGIKELNEIADENITEKNSKERKYIAYMLYLGPHSTRKQAVTIAENYKKLAGKSQALADSYKVNVLMNSKLVTQVMDIYDVLVGKDNAGRAFAEWICSVTKDGKLKALLFTNLAGNKGKPYSLEIRDAISGFISITETMPEEEKLMKLLSFTEGKNLKEAVLELKDSFGVYDFLTNYTRVSGKDAAYLSTDIATLNKLKNLAGLEGKEAYLLGAVINKYLNIMPKGKELDYLFSVSSGISGAQPERLAGIAEEIGEESIYNYKKEGLIVNVQGEALEKRSIAEKEINFSSKYSKVKGLIESVIGKRNIKISMQEDISGNKSLYANMFSDVTKDENGKITGKYIQFDRQFVENISAIDAIDQETAKIVVSAKTRHEIGHLLDLVNSFDIGEIKDGIWRIKQGKIKDLEKYLTNIARLIYESKLQSGNAGITRLSDKTKGLKVAIEENKGADGYYYKLKLSSENPDFAIPEELSEGIELEGLSFLEFLANIKLVAKDVRTFKNNIAYTFWYDFRYRFVPGKDLKETIKEVVNSNKEIGLLGYFLPEGENFAEEISDIVVDIDKRFNGKFETRKDGAIESKKEEEITGIKTEIPEEAEQDIGKDIDEGGKALSEEDAVKELEQILKPIKVIVTEPEGAFTKIAQKAGRVLERMPAWLNVLLLPLGMGAAVLIGMLLGNTDYETNLASFTAFGVILAAYKPKIKVTQKSIIRKPTTAEEVIELAGDEIERQSPELKGAKEILKNADRVSEEGFPALQVKFNVNAKGEVIDKKFQINEELYKNLPEIWNDYTLREVFLAVVRKDMRHYQDTAGYDMTKLAELKKQYDYNEKNGLDNTETSKKLAALQLYYEAPRYQALNEELMIRDINSKELRKKSGELQGEEQAFLRDMLEGLALFMENTDVHGVGKAVILDLAQGAGYIGKIMKTALSDQDFIDTKHIMNMDQEFFDYIGISGEFVGRQDDRLTEVILGQVIGGTGLITSQVLVNNAARALKEGNLKEFVASSEEILKIKTGAPYRHKTIVDLMREIMIMAGRLRAGPIVSDINNLDEETLLKVFKTIINDNKNSKEPTSLVIIRAFEEAVIKYAVEKDFDSKVMKDAATKYNVFWFTGFPSDGGAEQKIKAVLGNIVSSIHCAVVLTAGMLNDERSREYLKKRGIEINKGEKLSLEELAQAFTNEVINVMLSTNKTDIDALLSGMTEEGLLPYSVVRDVLKKNYGVMTHGYSVEADKLLDSNISLPFGFQIQGAIQGKSVLHFMLGEMGSASGENTVRVSDRHGENTVSYGIFKRRFGFSEGKVNILSLEDNVALEMKDDDLKGVFGGEGVVSWGSTVFGEFAPRIDPGIKLIPLNKISIKLLQLLAKANESELVSYLQDRAARLKGAGKKYTLFNLIADLDKCRNAQFLKADNIYNIKDVNVDNINTLKEKLGKAQTLEEEKAALAKYTDEIFAIVRESSRRVLKGKAHYIEQIMGALASIEGKIAEMATGEGKTITIALSAVALAL